ncbi:alpha/beta fold hydrolase [Hymenobacter profundi]|uniref:Alpha/beta fold hydrolase n=1 Tax=Hymenobacter profundi TaxID=1982110 RepID=A0ABS6X052_9BACT|nr:alpha/beta fold hydrolase [Hymenobacter profundi]
MDRLQQRGYPVVNVELPGHGADKTPAASITMNTYRDKVLAAINAQAADQVVLVGHSLGGAVISTVAEAAPTKIAKLIYVAGFLPADQQSVFGLAGQDSQSLLGAALSTSPDGTLASVDRAKLINIFCQDGSPAVQQQVLDNYRDEPAGAPAEQVTLTAANYGRVPKYYVRTLQDHALSPLLQELMLRATPVQKEYRLNTGHTPHLTASEELTNILTEIAQ